MPNFEHRPLCELCGHSAPKVLFDEPFENGKTQSFIQSYYRGRIPKGALASGRYTVLSCPKCEFSWQGQVLDDDGIETLYGTWISPEESLQKHRTRSYRYRSDIAHEVSMVPALFRTSTPVKLRVLDFGMGWGGWCQAARALGLDAEGAELSEARIAYGRQSGIPIQTDLFSTNEVYDFINTEQVFEHVKTPVALLGKLVQHLKPGGILRIAVPNGQRLTKAIRNGRWSPRKDSVHPLEHINSFSRKNVIEFAAKYNLKPLPLSRLLPAIVRSHLIGSSGLVAIWTDLKGSLFGTAIRFERIH